MPAATRGTERGHMRPALPSSSREQAVWEQTLSMAVHFGAFSQFTVLRCCAQAFQGQVAATRPLIAVFPKAHTNELCTAFFSDGVREAGPARRAAMQLAGGTPGSQARTPQGRIGWRVAPAALTAAERLSTIILPEKNHSPMNY